jgi:hypothetical protein
MQSTQTLSNYCDSGSQLNSTAHLRQGCPTSGHFCYLHIDIHYNKTGNVRKMQHSGAVTKPLLPWKSNKYYIFRCVSARHVALLIQHANLMRRIILSSVPTQEAPNFSTLSRKRHDFRGKKLLKIGVSIFLYAFYLKHFSF